MMDALDLNWGARMSEVQVTCVLLFTKLGKARSDRGCAGPAIDSAMERLSISYFEDAHRAIGSGSPALRCTPRSRLPHSGRIQRTEIGNLHDSMRPVGVADSRPLTDIFVESSKISAGARSSSRLIVLRCTVSPDSQTREAMPCCPNTCERGLILCR